MTRRIDKRALTWTILLTVLTFPLWLVFLPCLTEKRGLR